MAVQEAIMIRTLTKAMQRALRAWQNMQLGNLGSSLIIMGAISAAATILALIRPPERIFAYPNFVHIVLAAILAFIAISGLTGITVGMFLLSVTDPNHYRCLAMLVLWASCVAAAFAMGILLASAFSPS